MHVSIQLPLNQEGATQSGSTRQNLEHITLSWVIQTFTENCENSIKNVYQAWTIRIKLYTASAFERIIKTLFPDYTFELGETVMILERGGRKYW